MACSTSLALGIQASCDAQKKPGGVDKRIWLGSLDDLTAITFGAGNIITAFTFASTKGLVTYSGRREKNNAGSEIEVGENLTLRNQSVNLQVYWNTAEELATLDSLLDNEGLFAIIETNAGMLEVYGVNKGDNFNNFGLKATANVGNTGTVLNDSTAFALTLSGPHTNLQLLYNPATALATNIAALDALTIDPAP